MSGWQAFSGRPRWADELDFVGPRVRTASWAWVCLLGGLVALAAVWPDVNQLEQDEAEAQDHAKRLEHAAHQLGVQEQAMHAKGHAATPSKAKWHAETAQHAEQVVALLSYPWVDVLQTVERAAQTEQAALMSFHLDLSTLGGPDHASADVQLSAAVKDDVTALRWAQAHGPSAQLTGRSKLSGGMVADNGRCDWRAEATWSGGKP